MKEGIRVMRTWSIHLLDWPRWAACDLEKACDDLIKHWTVKMKKVRTGCGDYQKGVELIIIVISLMVMVMAIVIFTKTNNRHSLLSSNVRRHPNAPPLCQNKCKLFKLCFLWMYCLIIGRYEEEGHLSYWAVLESLKGKHLYSPELNVMLALMQKR